MEIVGGNFGASGEAELRDGALNVHGAVSAVIRPDEVESVATRKESRRVFSIPLFLFSFAAFGLLGWFFGGVIGLVVALVVSIAWAYGPSERVVAEVRLRNGKAVTVECSRKQADRLVRFAERR